MRELKFRVWSKRLNKYVGGMLIGQSGGLYSMLLGFEIIEEENDNYEVEQYTGLKDKNGKEIYEGDIVKFNETICIVEFDEMYARYTLRDLSDDVVIGFDALIISPFGVIGNIHENPELLEGKDD